MHCVSVEYKYFSVQLSYAGMLNINDSSACYVSLHVAICNHKETNQTNFLIIKSTIN